MKIVWDSRKDSVNLRKHGISLSLAEELFDAPTIEYQDVRRDYGERRIICYGIISSRVYCCIYTGRSSVRRVISLRKANKDETHDYFETIGA